ncbi:MAG: cysteine peptidase family C39 domain-containing protein [Tannerellaceae bacterium]|nr:cysteine peptidase family C39 domain-containing protein [Tannerellaceae bacterium]
MNMQYIRNTFTMAKDCPTGVACLLSIIRFHGGTFEEWFLSDLTNTRDGVTNLSGLKEGIEKLGFSTMAVCLQVKHLEHLSNPCVLFLEKEDGRKDYVVYYGMEKASYVIGDPESGIKNYPAEKLKEKWGRGVTLLLYPESSLLFAYKQKKLINQWIWNHIRKDRSYFWLSLLNAILLNGWLFLGMNTGQTTTQFILWLLAGVGIAGLFLKTKNQWENKVFVHWGEGLQRIVKSSRHTVAFLWMKCVLEKYPVTIMMIILSFITSIHFMILAFLQNLFLGLGMVGMVLLLSVCSYRMWKEYERHPFAGRERKKISVQERLSGSISPFKWIAWLNAGVISLFLYKLLAAFFGNYALLLFAVLCFVMISSMYHHFFEGCSLLKKGRKLYWVSLIYLFKEEQSRK